MGTSKQKAVLVDMERCVGCRACEVACQEEHGFSGTGAMVVVRIGPEEVADKLRLNFVPITCRHCTDPICVRGCPTGALRKTDAGHVQHNVNLCIGCKMCLQVCPFGAIHFNSQTGKVLKCDLCLARSKEGQGLACVHTCPAKALVYGEPDLLLTRKYSRVQFWAVHKPVEY